MPRRNDDELVYSTHPDRFPRRRPQEPEEEAPRGDGVARVRRERKGRRGKTVTVIEDVELTGDALAELLRELKRSCGSGGAMKGDALEIQGDCVDRVMEVLGGRGIRAKRAGG